VSRLEVDRDSIVVRHGRQNPRDECRLALRDCAAVVGSTKPTRQLRTTVGYAQFVADRPEAVVGRKIWSLYVVTHRPWTSPSTSRP
jgi:hypothetical protein